MEPNASETDTIRDYLKTLLKVLFIEGEGFSGKRPFGESGWKIDLYLSLVQGGIIVGTIDEDGYLKDCDYTAGDSILQEAIDSLW